MSTGDVTCVCVLTPSGRGAVAVVAVEGSAAVAAVDRYFQAANDRALDAQPLGRIIYGRWENGAGEDLIVCRRSEESVEVHCHGGRQSSTQIVADLAAAGCLAIDVNRWLAHHHACPISAAAQRALGQATTLRTAKILLTQYQGALRREIDAITAELATTEIDAVSRLERLLQFAEFGQHLTEPWRVVIAGQPNVGKSCLINAFVGYERAIVFDQPGTTRDVVSSSTAIDGWPVQLSDTAGLHQSNEEVESAGIALARERLAAADLVVWVLDAREIATAANCSGWELAQRQADLAHVQLDANRTQLVINKIDLVELPVQVDSPDVHTCAVSGSGVEQLLSTISTRLVPIIPPSGAAVPFTAEQVEALQAALNAMRHDDFPTARRCLRRLC